MNSPFRNQIIGLLVCLATSSVGVGQLFAQLAPVVPGPSQSKNAEKPSSEIPKPTKLAPEAQVAARRGMEFLKSKEYKKAIEIFKLAARMHPGQGQLRHLLGYAYAQDNQLGMAWLQFRQSVRLNPRYAQGIRDFLALWQVFENQGVFNAGRSAAEIVKLLGKPDSRTPQAGGEIWEYGFKRLHFLESKLAAVVDPRGLTPEITTATDKIEIDFDDSTRWRLGYRSLDRVQSLTEYIPQGQGMQKWDELFTVQRLHGLGVKQTPETMVKEIEANLKKANPNVEFRVLSQKPGDVLFHWRDVGSKTTKRQPQHEIVRLLAGPRDIHRLAYVRRVPQIPAEDAKVWAGLLSAAKLTSVAATPIPAGVTTPEVGTPNLK